MKKVLLVCGGDSNEYSVSIKSAKEVIKHIDYKLFEVKTVIIKNYNWYLLNSDFLDDNWINDSIMVSNVIDLIKWADIVLPILHGVNGEDGSIQGICQIFNVKYVGSNILSSSMCLDKDITKIMLNSINIKQVPYVIYNKERKLNIPYPVIIKPAKMGSSIGINIAHNKREFKKYIKIAKKYDDKILIEQYIKCREFECAILESNNMLVSDIGEVIKEKELYDYNSKYEDNTEIVIPADINKALKERIRELAIKAFKKMGCANLARIDFLYDENNDELYLNEINTIPGFTTISMYPKLIMQLGITYKELITILLKSK